MADESRLSKRRCPACGSSVDRGEGRCSVCGEALTWRLRRRGILIESGLVVLAVVLAVGGMLWLRERGRAPVDERAQVVDALIEIPPTEVPTFTAAPPPSPTPEPNTPFPPTATPLPETVTHVVVSGDTLYGIAIEYGVTLDAILAMNELSSSHSLSIGQELLVPLSRPEAAVAEAEDAADASSDSGDGDESPADAPPGASPDEAVAEAVDAAEEPPTDPGPASRPTGEPITVREAQIYRVQPGDTLLGIAVTHDLAVEDLTALNGLGEDETLSIGQEVLIRPAEVATTTPPPPPPTVPSTLAEAEAPVVAEPSGERMVPAPHLLAPGKGMVERSEAPLLRWSSSGVLPEDVYYVVSIRALPDAGRGESLQAPDGEGATGARPVVDLERIAAHDAEAERIWVFSNATAVRVPPSFRPAFGSSRTLEWSVTVRRRGASLIGADQGEILSSTRRRALWTFSWAPGESAAAPATASED